MNEPDDGARSAYESVPRAELDRAPNATERTVAARRLAGIMFMVSGARGLATVTSRGALSAETLDLVGALFPLAGIALGAILVARFGRSVLHAALVFLALYAAHIFSFRWAPVVVLGTHVDVSDIVVGLKVAPPLLVLLGAPGRVRIAIALVVFVIGETVFTVSSVREHILVSH